jgi:hypothetical protein
MNLIPNWRAELTRLWSMRITLVSVVTWSALGALWALWPAFAAVLPLGMYITIGIFLSAAIGIARLLKQPGAEQ